MEQEHKAKNNTVGQRTGKGARNRNREPGRGK
jgi:hypothetical protein